MEDAKGKRLVAIAHLNQLIKISIIQTTLTFLDIIEHLDDALTVVFLETDLAVDLIESLYHKPVHLILCHLTLFIFYLYLIYIYIDNVGMAFVFYYCDLGLRSLWGD